MKKIDVKNEKVKTQDALLVRQFPLKIWALSRGNHNFRMAWQKTSIVQTEQKQTKSQRRVTVVAQFHDTNIHHTNETTSSDAKVNKPPNPNLTINCVQTNERLKDTKKAHLKPHLNIHTQKNNNAQQLRWINCTIEISCSLTGVTYFITIIYSSLG